MEKLISKFKDAGLQYTVTHTTNVVEDQDGNKLQPDVHTYQSPNYIKLDGENTNKLAALIDSDQELEEYLLNKNKFLLRGGQSGQEQYLLIYKQMHAV